MGRYDFPKYYKGLLNLAESVELDAALPWRGRLGTARFLLGAAEQLKYEFDRAERLKRPKRKPRP